MISRSLHLFRSVALVEKIKYFLKVKKVLGCDVTKVASFIRSWYQTICASYFQRTLAGSYVIKKIKTLKKT